MIEGTTTDAALEAAVDATTGTDAAALEDDGQRTFTGDYVAKLRAEAASHRTRAKALQSELVTAWAAIDGRLVDPDDLDPATVVAGDDGTVARDDVVAAIDELLARKPHLARQRPPMLPQGARIDAPAPTLLELMRGR